MTEKENAQSIWANKYVQGGLYGAWMISTAYLLDGLYYRVLFVAAAIAFACGWYATGKRDAIEETSKKVDEVVRRMSPQPRSGM